MKKNNSVKADVKYSMLCEGQTAVFGSWEEKVNVIELAKQIGVKVNDTEGEYNDYADYPALTFHGGKILSHKGGAGHIITKDEFVRRVKAYCI